MQGTEPTRTTDDEADRVPDDVLTDLLADEDCRRILAVLAGTEGAIAVCDLARGTLARERDVDPSALDDESVAAVREDLFQSHLPRLTPTGLVQYDSLLGTVALDTDDERVHSAVE